MLSLGLGFEMEVLVKPFEELTIKNIELVGGKNASLGEMIQNLTPMGVSVPSGFAITSNAYWLFLEENGIREKLEKLFKGFEKGDLTELARVGKEARTLIELAKLPDSLSEAVRSSYAKMEERYGKNVSVAVRSSATAEDLPNASFAGQQETYLNVKGADDLVAVCPYAFASLYTDRAISYREDHGFSQTKIALSIGVQKMVRSDLASAGVIFTLDTESGHDGVVFINSAYGLGELVVKGSISPDEFFVHKETLNKGSRPILKKRKGTKRKKMLLKDALGTPKEMTFVESVSPGDQERYSLNDDEILELSVLAIKIENHYSKLHKKPMPMDIEWAKDGEDGKLYIVQARPETVHSNVKAGSSFEVYSISSGENIEEQTVLATGKSVGSKIVTGAARVILSPSQIKEVQKGDVLVTTMTDPDWEPIMKLASAIVTEQGGRTSHAAIVSRELGIAAVVGTGNSTTKIKTGEMVTVDCSSGEVGRIFKGKLDFDVEEVEVEGLKPLPVELMVNVGNPDSAFKAAMIPNDGVGLARLEFIIASTIQAHPMAFVESEKLDEQTREELEKIMLGEKKGTDFFVDVLAREVATIAAAFYPKPVIVRFSDFKSNEYRGLLGGNFFEPNEANPMLGLRGASRYSHKLYREAFKLECEAMCKVREQMGMTNVKLMLPFVRTVEEAKNVIDILESNGLARGQNGLELFMMCELPSNVLMMEEFSKHFDGFSIGSNDLTQFTFGLDRDSELVQGVADERGEALRRMVKMAIDGAKKNGKKIGICGQAPSDYLEFAKFLVDAGIDSISLTSDSLLKIRKHIG
jgi:pyruvate, water dikinase